MTTATKTQPTKHTDNCVRQRAKFSARSKAGDRCSCGQQGITLSNFRVTYRAPRYENDRVLYDGYCTILADDAEHDGAEVRVFDVPDADEGQLAVALFACEAMNQHERLVAALRNLMIRFEQTGEAWMTDLAMNDAREVLALTNTPKE